MTKGAKEVDITSWEWPKIENYWGRRPYGTQSVDWEERINFDRMRQYKLSRMKEMFKKHDVGAMLAINEWNMRYITSTWNAYWTTPSSGLRYAMLPATAKGAILYEQGEIGFQAKQIAPWLDKVKVAITGAGWIGRTMGPKASIQQRDKMVRQILDDLKDYGVAKERLALDTWDPGLVEAFTKAGVKLVPGLDIMLDARKIKNEDEVNCLRTCAAIGDAMFSAIAANLRPGVKESELCGIAHEVAYRLGARIYSGVFVTSGPFAWPNPRDESDRMICPGDIVYADVYNTAYEGYKICYYRTFSCGKPSQKAKDDYKKSVDWLYDAIRLIKPGVTTKELAEKWPPGPEIWKDIHIVSEDQTAGSNWGHGIGLTLYEYPIIWRQASLYDPIPLEKGMTFAIETQHGTPGSHGVRMEEMVHVTENGYEIMSKWPIQELTEVPLF